MPKKMPKRLKRAKTVGTDNIIHLKTNTSDIQWADEFSVGVRGIDEQHKILMEIINEFADALRKSESQQRLHDTLEKIIRYVTAHFAAEELLMSSAGYDNLSRHSQNHDRFLKQIKEYKEKLNRNQKIYSIELLTFLHDWWIDHTLKADKGFVEHLKSMGLK